MLNPDNILKTAHQRINDCLSVQDWWRANEVRDNYNLIEGDQWLEDAILRQNADGMPVRTVNKSAVLMNAFCGFEVQHRGEVSYVPRQPTEQQEGESDLGNDGAQWIEDTSQAPFQKSLAVRDMGICGVGVVDHIMDYDTNPDGELKVERVFPYFILWDVAARAKNLKDANWVCRAKVVDKESLENYIKDASDSDEVDAGFGAAEDARFLDYFDTVMIAKSLGVIYEYQWREKVPFYRIENPFIGMEGFMDDPYTQQILMLAKEIQESYEVDIGMDKIFSIDSKDYKPLKDAFEALGLPFKATKQKKFKYFRANIVGNRIFDIEENYSQQCFSLRFMTANFSEVRQCFFGLMRPMKDPQRMYNQAISDYEGFLRTIPKGGVEIEADAVPDLEAFVQTYTKAREVTIYNPGGLGKARPKLTPPIPSGLLDMINFASNAMMESTGITPNFLGLTDSKEMTATLDRQMVRQGLTVLSTYFDAIKYFTIDQGQLFIDALRILTENSPGRLISIAGKEGLKYQRLFQSRLAAEYDVVVEEVPQTPSERQDTFEKLLQMAALLANKPNPIDIMPMVVQYSPLKGSQIKEITTLMQPPPPTPPDPIAQGLLVAETKLKESTAEKNIADATKSKLDVLLKQKELANTDEVVAAEVQKILADAALSQTKAMNEAFRTT